jgi:hypothetical protein
LKRSSFLLIASKLTHADTILRKAVDYVTGFLLNDYFELLVDIIEFFAMSVEDKKLLLAELEIAKGYLKHGFDKKIRSESSNTSACIAHRVAYALGQDDSTDAFPEDTELCEECRYLFYVMERLDEEVKKSPMNKSAIDALLCCQEKIALFMGHRVRVINQQSAIAKHYKDMRSRYKIGEAAVECIITLD